jgi:23S rRNA (adenine2030-N6)-methyltransferase
MEWHNQEVLNLKRNIRGSHVAIHHRDGNEGLVAMTPPKPARGMVLIDPAYESPQDYQQVVTTVSKAYKKWPTGIYAIWYPLLLKRNRGPRDVIQPESFEAAPSKQGKSQDMLEQLKLQGFKSLLSVELNVQDETRDEGMYGSGMAIINAPWQLDEQLRACLQDLVPLLGQSPKAKGAVNWLITDD